jgi:Xaa-Pro dipeptidase
LGKITVEKGDAIINIIIDRIQKALAANEVNALVAMSPESIVWATGVHIPSQRMIRERMFFLIVPQQGEPLMVFSNVVEPTVKRHSWIPGYEKYREYYDIPIEFLVKTLKEKHLLTHKVWLEMDYLPANCYRVIAEAFPKVTFINCFEELNSLRVVKTPEEIALLQRLSRIAEQGMQYGCMISRCGDTELQVADAYTEGHVRLGLEGVPFRIMGVGPINSRQAFNEPSSQVIIEEGDLVYADYAGLFQGYYSDTARMAVVGKPNQEQREIYRIVRNVQRGVISRMRPGMTAGETYGIGAQLMEGYGHKLAARSIGHSIGVTVHEHPNLVAGNREVLLSNSVINIELDLSLEGIGKFHLEDTTLLTEEGAYILSDSTNTEEMFSIR